MTTRPTDQAHREARALKEIVTCLVDAPASVGRDGQRVLRIGRAAIELEPGSGDGWLVVALGHYLVGDWDAAHAAFRKANELNAKLSVVERMFFAMTLWRRGNEGEALRQYQSADAQRGGSPLGFVQREAAELMGVKIAPATQPSG